MNRVVRKKNPTYTCQHELKIKSANYDFVIIDR